MSQEQLRPMLVLALCVITFLMWQAWQIDYGPRPDPEPATTGAPAASGVPTAAAPATATPSMPQSGSVPQAPVAAAPVVGQPAAVAPPTPGEQISVRTDVIDVRIGVEGGGIEKVDLLGYPVQVDEPDVPFTLLTGDPATLFIAQSGLLGAEAAPNHQVRYEASATAYELTEGSDSLNVDLVWREGAVTVTKTYTFTRGSYLVNVAYKVSNASEKDWVGRMYGQFQRRRVEPEGGLFRTYTYTGGVVSYPDKPYEKIDFDDMSNSDLDLDVTGGWVAMIQHYFAGAWVPDQEVENHFYSIDLKDGRYVLGLMSPVVSVAAGTEGLLSLGVYTGPKIADNLSVAAPHLERTVDYGWLWFIAEPLFWGLTHIHDIIGNWGWSIIVLTLVIKLVFFHLSATSYKSMARMRKVQPRIVALRDRYSSDKQRMNQEMMKLYKEEKINPLGGCLPIVIQIPVFIALYWVLLESVELRQASFIGWLTDLSVHDPYFVLPILMGATMLVQQKLNPAPPDPMQARIMMALPFVFTFLFLFFPSGLVLYWFVNNLLSIAQQWVITRKIVGPDG